MRYMGLLSTHIFLPLVKAIIVPLVFSTLVVGVAGHGDDLSKLRRLANKSLIYFVTLTIISVFIGLAYANLLQPGAGIVLPKMNAEDEQVINTSHKLTLESMASYFSLPRLISTF